jgi:hypothetical protein
MTKSRLSRSVRKYIRRQKALIRRLFSDPAEVDRRLKELSQKFFKQNG